SLRSDCPSFEMQSMSQERSWPSTRRHLDSLSDRIAALKTYGRRPVGPGPDGPSRRRRLSNPTMMTLGFLWGFAWDELPELQKETEGKQTKRSWITVLLSSYPPVVI